MLLMSSVSPTASTWYLTGVLFCKAVVAAGPAAFPSLPCAALHPAEIPSSNLYPGCSWDAAGSHRHQHYCVNPATTASSQNPYVLKKQHVSDKTGRRAGSHPCPSPNTLY